MMILKLECTSPLFALSWQPSRQAWGIQAFYVSLLVWLSLLVVGGLQFACSFIWVSCPSDSRGFRFYRRDLVLRACKAPCTFMVPYKCDLSCYDVQRSPGLGTCKCYQNVHSLKTAIKSSLLYWRAVKPALMLTAAFDCCVPAPFMSSRTILG